MGFTLTQTSSMLMTDTLRGAPRRSVKESVHREHLNLMRIKGELHSCAGAPTRTSVEWRLFDTSAKHRAFLSLSLLQAFTFEQFISCLYILRIVMLE